MKIKFIRRSIQWDIYTITWVLFFLCFIVFGLILKFGPTEMVCADVYSEGITKGSKTYTYKYFVSGKGWYRSSSGQSLIARRDGIFEAECVKVRYNLFFPSSSIIVDQRFVD